MNPPSLTSPAPAEESNASSNGSSGNLTRMQSQVSQQDRWQLMQQRGIVLWMTGLSGAGKSTLAMALESRLHSLEKKSYVLDGDNLRHGLCRDLGFSHADRAENIRRVGEAAKLLAQAGHVAVCSFISPFEEDRQQVREICAEDGIPLAVVFVDAPLWICEQRDPKGLYKRARSGEIRDFTGISSPYEPPLAPELWIQTGTCPLETCLDELSAYVLALCRIPADLSEQAINRK